MRSMVKMVKEIDEEKRKELGIEEKEWKQKKAFYDEREGKIYVVGELNVNPEQEAPILRQIGECFVNHLLLGNRNSINTHFANLLNELKKENRVESELHQLLQSPPNHLLGLEYLGATFVNTKADSFCSEHIFEYKQQIVQMFGELFVQFYGSKETREVLSSASPELYTYMYKLTYNGEEHKKFETFYKEINKKGEQGIVEEANKRYTNWANKVSEQDRKWLERYKEKDPPENEIAKKILGNIDEMKERLHLVLDWQEYYKQMDEKLRPPLQKISYELNDTIIAIQKTNELIKHVGLITDKDQMVYVYFDEEQWGYPNRTDLLNLMDQFTYGYLSGIPIAELIERDNSKPIKIKVHVPKGSAMADLGDGKVAFPMDQYGLLRTGEGGSNSYPYTNKVTLSAKLVPKKEIETKKKEQEASILKDVAYACEAKKLTREMSLLLAKLIHFEFKGLHLEHKLHNARKVLLNWMNNPFFSASFLENIIFSLANRNPRGAIIFIDRSIPVNIPMNVLDLVDSSARGAYYKELSQIHLKVTPQIVGTKPEHSLLLDFTHELGHLVKDLLFNKYKMFLEEINRCFHEEKEYLDERTIMDLKNGNGIDALNNKEEFFAEVFRNMYATTGRRDASAKEARNLIVSQAPQTVKLIELAMNYFNDSDTLIIQENNKRYSYLRAKIDAYGSGETNGEHGIGNEHLIQFDGDLQKLRDTKIQLEQMKYSNVNNDPTILNKHMENKLQLVSLEKALNDIEIMNEYILQPVNQTKEDFVVYFSFNPEDWGHPAHWCEKQSLTAALKDCALPCLQVATLFKSKSDKRIQVKLIVPAGTYAGHLRGGKVIFPTNCRMKMMGEIEQLEDDKRQDNRVMLVTATLIAQKQYLTYYCEKF